MNRNGKKYTQYKAIKKYKEIVSKQKEIETISTNLINSNDFKNKVNYLSNEIIIKDDWISKIEFYLPYLSLAISENRRFILNQGETYDIEKVRKVSKDSIYDLAKHADKIRKVNQENEVEPKKLYVIEKNDDYSLYENRFLVFLLNMLKSFVNVRFDKIKDAQSKREIVTNLKNDDLITVEGLYFNIEMHDIKHREFKLEENDVNFDKINRINAISSQISRLSNSELIKLVSKAASLSEPIIKNNVIKNDPNFIKCFELYEFLKSYTEDGFERKSINKDESLSKEAIDYFKYIPSLISFLSYSSIKNLYENLEDELTKESIENEIRRNEEIEKTLNDFLNGRDINEETVKETIYKIFKKSNESSSNLAHQKKLYEKQIAELTDNFEMQIDDLKNTNSELNDKILINENNFKLKIEGMEKSQQEEIERLENAHKEDLFNLEAKHQNEINEINKHIEQLNGEIKALRILTDESFKNEKLDIEQFNLTEKEFDAFFKYMEENWKKVKKDVDNKKKKEIKEKFKKKEKFNGK